MVEFEAGELMLPSKSPEARLHWMAVFIEKLCSRADFPGQQWAERRDPPTAGALRVRWTPAFAGVTARQARLRNTRSHTPWPSFRPRFSNFVSGR